jgi:anti-sigma factor RsiW
MRRDELEMYLDGELDAQRRSAVALTLATDAEARQMLERVRAERTLRVAALGGYAPPAAEAAAFGARMLAQMRAAYDAPLARIGVQVWVRRLTGIAAALVLASGTYWMGRAQQSGTTAQTQPTTVAPQTQYVVYVPSTSGVTTRKEFTSESAAQAYAAEVQQELTTINGQVAMADTRGVF